MSVAFTLNANAASIFIDGKLFTFNKDHPNFEKAIQAIKDKDYQAIPGLMDLTSGVRRFIEGSPITMRGGSIFYNEEQINGFAVNQLLERASLDLPVEPVVRFLESYHRNPSYKCREQLDRFVEANKLPILDDGRLLVIRWVKDNYWDSHTGSTFRSLPGAVHTMPRSAVDDDPNRTCSAGIHVCSRGYGKFAERMMAAAVWPEDVVSVPVDYNDSKMRVCRVEILHEVNEADWPKYEAQPNYSSPQDDQDDDDDVIDDVTYRVEVIGLTDDGTVVYGWVDVEANTEQGAIDDVASCLTADDITWTTLNGKSVDEIDSQTIKGRSARIV